MQTRSCAALVGCFTSLFALMPAVPAQDGRSTMGRNAAKRFAELGMLPAPEVIVVRDIINYHRHRIPLPRAGENVALDLRWDAPLPVHYGESVLQIGLATTRVHDAKSLRPLNLALVIDCSGSMADGDKMCRVKQGLLRFVDKLRPTDRLSIVVYSSEAEVCLPSQLVGDRRKVKNIIRGLRPSGYTNLHGGLMLGYREVAKHCDDGRGDSREPARGASREFTQKHAANHRVILLTDGIANRGKTDAAAIAADSKACNDRGIDLSTVGVGKDFDHDLLAKLAKSGRGLFHFVSDNEDIQKVFVTEAQSLIGIVARDITLEVSHGPDVEVARVYGYDPKMREDGFHMPLDNFNYGMTGVVMVKFRHTKSTERDGRGSQVQVRLTYRGADDGRKKTLTARSKALDPVRAFGATDHVVRKNFTIAVLASATRQMAELAKASKFGAAERTASLALEFFRHHYKFTDDKDLRHNMNVLEKYRKILSRRIERFRRL